MFFHVAFCAENIRYPDAFANAPVPLNFEYSLEMLKLAIQKSGSHASLEPMANELNQTRKLIDVKEKKFDLFWSATSKDLERDLIPVRICLMKGLNGWRIPVVTKRNASLFQHVSNLKGLKNLSAGQGFNWIDTDILQASDIKVERSYETDSLYNMLIAGRFDYFPRGVQEVWREIEIRKNVDIAIDPYIAIHYTSPHYFFVRPDKPEIAAMITQGLEIAIKDGSFDKLFYRYYGAAITKAHLDNRKIIELTNPQLTPETPLARKNLWFVIGDIKAMPK